MITEKELSKIEISGRIVNDIIRKMITSSNNHAKILKVNNELQVVFDTGNISSYDLKIFKYLKIFCIFMTDSNGQAIIDDGKKIGVAKVKIIVNNEEIIINLT